MLPGGLRPSEKSGPRPPPCPAGVTRPLTPQIHPWMRFLGQHQWGFAWGAGREGLEMALLPQTEGMDPAPLAGSSERLERG